MVIIMANVSQFATDITRDQALDTSLYMAALHAEAARQHAAAADVHALAAGMHLEVITPSDETPDDITLEAINASADAALQGDTAAEASSMTDMKVREASEAQREAADALRQAEDGEDPRDAHAVAAAFHATAASRHSEAARKLSPGSEMAEVARAEAESATLTAADAAGCLPGKRAPKE